MQTKDVSVIMGFRVILFVVGITGSFAQVANFRFMSKGQGPGDVTLKNAVIGDDVRIDCTTNDAFAKVQLMRINGSIQKTLTVDQRYLRKIGQNFLLKIRSFRDGGDIHCVASSGFEFINKKIVISVVGTAKSKTPEPVVEPSSQVIKQNTVLRMNCSAPGKLTKLKWVKDGKEINKKLVKETIITVPGDIFVQLALTIPNAQVAETGFYKCYATTLLNPGYSDEVVAVVNVKALPVKWVHNSPFWNIVKVNAEESAVIDCSLTSPDVDVTFLMERNDGTVSVIRADGRKYRTLNKQRLIIRRATLSDSAQYRCRARGVNDKSVVVFVNPAGSRYLKPTIDARTLRLEYFGKGEITCMAYGNDISLTWYKESKDGLDLMQVPLWRTEVKGGHTPQGHYRRVNILKFVNATLQDSGDYLCKASKIGNSGQSEFQSVVVRVKNPKKPIINRFSSITTREGSNVTFLCRAKGSPVPEVTFWRRGMKLDTIKGKYRIDHRVLHVENVAFPTDDGVITCVARSHLGEARANATLTIQVPPKLKIGNEIIFASSNQTTNISCQVDKANPLPTISWLVQPSACSFTESDCHPLSNAWEQLPPGKSRIIPAESEKTTRSALVGSLIGFQYFFVQCTADNGVAQARRVIKYINKVGKDKILKIEPSVVSENEGGELKLACLGTPGLFSTLTWVKDGKAVTETPGVHLMYTRTSNYVQEVVLYLNKTIPSHSGLYSCNATKKINKIDVLIESVQVAIKAIYKPRITQLVNIETNQSSTILLSCQVDANPPARVSWFRNGAEMTDISPLYHADNCENSENGHYYKMNSAVKRSELIICNADYRSNNATYMCLAENSLGRENTSASVFVSALPSIVRAKSSLYVSVGKDLAEKCVAGGNPLPYVWWEKRIDGKYYILGKKTLERSYLNFKRIRKEEFGDYRCVAQNSLGVTFSKLAITKINTGAASADELARSNIATRNTLIATVVVASCLIILLSVISVVLYKRKRLYGGFYIFAVPPAPDYLKKIDPSRALAEQTNKLPYDVAWEFPRTRVKLINKLGSGAFGEVFSAEAVGILAHDPRYRILTKQKPLLGRRRASRSGSTSSHKTSGSTSSMQGITTRGSFSRGSFIRLGSSRGSYRHIKGYKNLVTKVAIKKLKDDATPLELRDLISELKILIHIGEHPNIVNLLGACTKGKENEMMVILEYAPYGNLLSFLKERRPVFKPVLTKEHIGMNKELTTLDLVVSAYQIAKGMEYLSSRKCVHRDLAARNVLVGDNYVMKIADFGLARDIYKDDRYVKVTGGLLPIKWMALEAIKERVFTHQSDVWSFGVLLWELMTLGGSPYPGMPTKDLLEFLTAGYRMEQPINCPPEIYAVMRDCWHTDPNDRPIFFEIVNQLARFIEQNCTSDECVSYLDAAHLSGDDYLQPVDSPAPVFTPPPPYTPNGDSKQQDNKFFRSSDGYLPCNREENEKERIAMSDLKKDAEDNNTSERKRKADEREREKRKPSDSDGSQHGTDDAVHGKQQSLPNGHALTKKEKHTFDEDKDVDESEGLLGNGQPHRYINEDMIVFEDRSYINA